MWQDKFELGIPEIDGQHKTLVSFVGQVKGLIRDAEDGIDCYDEIDTLLHELKDYTVYHFEAEEDLMEKNNYSDFDNHKAEHDAFIQKIQVFFESDIDYHQLTVLEELTEFLLDWVVAHILESDTKYVSVLA